MNDMNDSSFLLLFLLSFGVASQEPKHVCLLVHLFLSGLDSAVVGLYRVVSQTFQVLPNVRNIHQF